MRGRPVLTPAQVKEVRTVYARGSLVVGMPALARRYGVSKEAIRRVIGWQTHKRVTDGKPTPEAKLSLARKYLANGYSLASVAAYVGVSTSELDVALWDSMGTPA